MRIRKRIRRQRKGFTLMEILLVTAILVVMASMATFAYLKFQQTATSRTVESEISKLKSACTMYHSSVQSFPASLNDLMQQPQGISKSKWGGPYFDNDTDFNDAWGTPYKYTPDPVNLTVSIISAGPDKSFGTEDDIPELKTRSTGG